MRSFYAYVHCRPDGTPFYVGKGCDRRASRVLNKNRNSYHQAIVKKHGAANIVVLTSACQSEGEAFQLERELIGIFRNHFRLANFNDGGEGSANPSEETRARMSTAKLGRPMPQEVRARISATLKGRPKSAEHAAKAGLGQKGRISSPETRAKMSATRKGRKQPPELVKKRAEANRGRKRSEEFKAKISAIAKARYDANPLASNLKRKHGVSGDASECRPD
jgi:hypothetical protein